MSSLAEQEFRIRKIPGGYKVWQRVGSGWEALSDVYGSRGQARAAIEGFKLDRAVM